MIPTTWLDGLSESRRLVYDSFAAFTKAEISPDRVRATPSGHDQELWHAVVAMGFHRASLAESAGGAGGDLVDAVLVGFRVGSSLAPIPYVDYVPAARLAQTIGMQLSALADDDIILAAEAVDVDAGAIFSAGAVADAVLVLEEQDASLHAVDRSAAGAQNLANLGRLPLGAVVPAPQPTQTAPLTTSDRVGWVTDRRLIASAVLLGAGRRALELASEHAGQREQFGRPIGSFQAIQHRLADRIADVEAAEQLVLASAGATDNRPRRTATALISASAAAEHAAKDALQLFGGYGVSTEYDIHLYLRFVKAWNVLSNDSALITDALPPRVGNHGPADRARPEAVTT